MNFAGDRIYSVHWLPKYGTVGLNRLGYDLTSGAFNDFNYVAWKRYDYDVS